MLRVVARHIQGSRPSPAAAEADKPVVACIMGFGDGVGPNIMTDANAADVLDAQDPSIREILQAGRDCTLVNYDEAMARPGGVDGVLLVAQAPLSAEEMDVLTPTVVSNCGVGVQQIDTDAATERGIAVGNTPGVVSQGTADMAMALMLACARRLGEADHYSKSGEWQKYDHMLLVGQDVSGSTVGIVGMGRIGYEVARRCKLGFDCQVLYHNRNRRPDCEEELGCEYASLDGLLARSDFVVVLTDLSDSTRGIINAAALRKMKNTATLVNCSRGPTVETDALVAALESGEIASAGLDVIDPEPPAPDHPIYKLHNVIIPPHRGTATVNTRRRMAQLQVDNLLAGLAGTPLPAQCNE